MKFDYLDKDDKKIFDFFKELDKKYSIFLETQKVKENLFINKNIDEIEEEYSWKRPLDLVIIDNNKR